MNTQEEIELLRKNLTAAFEAIRLNEKNLLDLTNKIIDVIKNQGTLEVAIKENTIEDLISNKETWDKVEAMVASKTDKHINKKSRNSAISYTTIIIGIFKLIDYLTK